MDAIDVIQYLIWLSDSLEGPAINSKTSVYSKGVADARAAVRKEITDFLNGYEANEKKQHETQPDQPQIQIITLGEKNALFRRIGIPDNNLLFVSYQIGGVEFQVKPQTFNGHPSISVLGDGPIAICPSAANHLYVYPHESK